jgi:hypothetical protein
MENKREGGGHAGYARRSLGFATRKKGECEGPGRRSWRLTGEREEREQGTGGKREEREQGTGGERRERVRETTSFIEEE